MSMLNSAALWRAGILAAGLGLAACAGTMATADRDAAIPVDPDIADWAQAYVDDGKLAGLVTLVAREGNLDHLSVHGVQDLETGTPMVRETLFRIYSMTKPITGVGVMMLVEEGKIGLDDPVGDYLPALADPEVFVSQADDGTIVTEPAERAITVRDLLTHNAGMTYGVFGNHPVDQLYLENELLTTGLSNAEFVDRLGGIPLLKQPHTGWHYSVSVDVQGRLIEVVSGQSLDVFFEERIFEPLGMDETAFFAPDEDLDRLATVYMRSEEGDLVLHPQYNEAGIKTESFQFLSGGAGLVSTIDDYWRFAQAMLDGGTLDGVRILKEETVDLMRRNHLPQDQLPYSQSAPGHGFGLGFSVVMEPQKPSENAGRYAWGGAASTVFWIDPEDDTIAVLMTQMGPSSTYPLRNEFEALVHGD